MTSPALPREGDLYRTYCVDGRIFEIRYGYYDECERDRVEPLPVFPDLSSQLLYTAEGERIVTLVQHPCARYTPKDPLRSEEWCGDCSFYSGGRDEIGVCRNISNRRAFSEQSLPGRQ